MACWNLFPAPSVTGVSVGSADEAESGAAAPVVSILSDFLSTVCYLNSEEMKKTHLDNAMILVNLS